MNRADGEHDHRPQPQRGSPHQTPLWKKALFSVITSLVFFLAVELIMWIVGAEPLIEREDPFRGFSSLVSVFERDGEVFRTRPATRYETFNDQSFAALKPRNGVRLFCVGGSSSYGFPWGAEVAFTAILGDVLAAAHPDREIEAINTSGISYAMHRLGIVVDEIINYEPDILMVYSGHNEFIEPSFFDQLKRRSRLRNSLEYPLLHSRIYSALRSLWVRSSPRGRSAAKRFGTLVRRETVVYSSTQKKAVIEEYETGLRRIVRLAHKRGVKVVLATVPCNLRGWRPQGSTLGAALGEHEQSAWTAAFRNGQRKLDAGQFEAALSDLREAAKVAPNHAETHYLLGRVYEGLHRWGEARTAYQRACDSDASPIRRVSGINEAIRVVADDEGALLVDVDRIFEDLSEHGLVGFELIEDYVHPTLKGHRLIAWHVWRAIEEAAWFGSERAARELFERVVADRPTASPDANWLYNQGCVLWNQGLARQAIERFRQVLEISPHPGALGNLAILLADSGQLEEATRLCERLVDLDPDYAEAHDHLGTVLARQGRLEEAVVHYRRALEIRPDFAEAHNHLGMALRSRGKIDEAIRHYRHALKTRYDYAEAYNNLGNALSQRGARESAMAQYRRALELKPDYAEAHNNLAVALRSQGRVDEAIRHYRRALETNPDYAEAHSNVGNALAALGQYEEAVEHYREALRLEPTNARAHNNLASALEKTDRLDEALEHFRMALRLQPDMFTSEIGIAWILATHPDERMRDAHRAVDLAKRAVATTRNRSLLALDALAAAYAAAGEYPRAVETAKEALALTARPQPPGSADDIRRRLELYTRSKPYRRTLKESADTLRNAPRKNASSIEDHREP